MIGRPDYQAVKELANERERGKKKSQVEVRRGGGGEGKADRRCVGESGRRSFGARARLLADAIRESRRRSTLVGWEVMKGSERPFGRQRVEQERSPKAAAAGKERDPRPGHPPPSLKLWGG